jgi:hypothetical protein
VDAKEAVKIAISAVVDAYAATNTVTKDVRLEEFQKSRDGHWLVTVSFVQPEPVASGTTVSAVDVFRALGGTQIVRLYKVVELDESGNALAMKIRTTDV